MTYKEHILETLFRAYQAFGTTKSGEPRSRYKSWEYCHSVFLELHKKDYKDLSENDFDYLALNLAFFLASWGMYRGSSFLLQRDYKTHISAVKIIMENKYDILWDFDPRMSDTKYANDLLFKKQKENDEKGLYFRLEDLYSQGIIEENLLANLIEIEDRKKTAIKEKKPTDTLITKILLATLACIPAFDSFFKKSCKNINPHISDKPNNAFKDLCKFTKKYFWELQFKCKDVYHPPMKVLDLYFWRIGLGLSLIASSNKKRKKDIGDSLICEKYFDDINTLNSSNNIADIINFPNGLDWRK